MSKLIENHLHSFPPDLQQEIQSLQQDSQMLRLLCLGDPGQDLDILRRVGRAIMTYIHQREFREQNNSQNIGDLLLEFYDQLGDVYAYSGRRFGTTVEQG